MNSGQVAHFIGPGDAKAVCSHQTMSPMQEIELKFQIPEGVLAAIQTELSRINLGADADLRLRAAYFDTPDRLLGAARMALRVRQEGDEWVQTLKAGGSNTMVRLEANCPAQAPSAGEPILADLSRHLGTPAQEALTRVLNWDAQQDPQGRHCALTQLYGTDITRTRAQIAVGQGTAWAGVVELALDLGRIHAGSLSVAVRELEIELLSGHPMAVINAGRDWVHRHGLWLDTQTKAHRGDRLARLAAHADQPDGKAAVDTTPVAEQWQVALQGLIALGETWSGSPHALPADTLDLARALRDQLGDVLGCHADAGSSSSAIDLARSKAATDLCLDLLRCVMLN
jgi:inorganic triphosphatase YgiF